MINTWIFNIWFT